MADQNDGHAVEVDVGQVWVDVDVLEVVKVVGDVLLDEVVSVELDGVDAVVDDNEEVVLDVVGSTRVDIPVSTLDEVETPEVEVLLNTELVILVVDPPPATQELTGESNPE